MQWPTLLPALICTWSSRFLNKMSHLSYLLAFLMMSMSSLSHAGDAAHKACVGIVSEENEGITQLKKITVTYDDVRASDGEQRKYTLSISHKGKNYTGTSITAAENAIAIKIVNKENQSDVLFEGTFKTLENNGLELQGKSFLQGETQKPLHVVLECGDIAK